MERNIKFLIIILLFWVYPSFVKAEDTISLITPQPVDFNICTRNYNIPSEKLFYLSIASAKENRFEVNEIQSKTGYILFTAAGKQYLASVIKLDNENSQLKITPTNNNYFFQPGIVLNFFKYIELNSTESLQEVKVVN